MGCSWAWAEGRVGLARTWREAAPPLQELQIPPCSEEIWGLLLWLMIWVLGFRVGWRVFLNGYVEEGWKTRRRGRALQACSPKVEAGHSELSSGSPKTFPPWTSECGLSWEKM